MRILFICDTRSGETDSWGPGMARRVEEVLTRYYPDRTRLATAYMEKTQEEDLPAVRTGLQAQGQEGAVTCFERDGVLYYPLRTDLSMGDGIPCWETSKKLLLQVVEDFQPDLIQCFGSEWPYGAIAEDVAVPVVIHMMGFLNIYFDSLDMVRGYRKGLEEGPDQRPGGRAVKGRSAVKAAKRRIKAGLGGLKAGIRAGLGMRPPAGPVRPVLSGSDGRRLRPEEVAAAFERRVMKANHYYMGRTDWDREIVRYYADDARYFHVPEPMKPRILAAAGQWNYQKRDRLQLLTISSADDRKGNEIILRTALLLRDLVGLDVTWRVAGAREFFPFFEERTGIRREEVGVELLGPIGQDRIVRELLEADFFIHPSIMDNSPNSVCEAQLIGCPVIASNVGGTPQIVEDGKTGFLYPYNEPHTLAFLIGRIRQEKTLLTDLSRRETAVAVERHDPARLADCLVRTYEEILEDYETKKICEEAAGTDPVGDQEPPEDRGRTDLETGPLYP